MPSSDTYFKAGREKTGGRVAGTPNKNTREYKEAVMKCANDPKFIEKMKKERPDIFVRMVAAVIPKDVNLGSQEDNKLEIRIRGYQGDGD